MNRDEKEARDSANRTIAAQARIQESASLGNAETACTSAQALAAQAILARDRGDEAGAEACGALARRFYALARALRAAAQAYQGIREEVANVGGFVPFAPKPQSFTDARRQADAEAEAAEAVREALAEARKPQA